MKSSALLVSLSCFLLTIASAMDANCGPGYFVTNGGSCKKCPKGTYQPLSNQNVCKPCPDGMVSTEEGSVECGPCTELNKEPSELKDTCVCVSGAVLNRKGTACHICSPGSYFTPWRNRGRCNPCPRGQYQPLEGQTSCLDCPEGTTSSTRATECVTCPAGEFPMSDNICGTCPAGETPSPFGHNCRQCERGSFKPERGSGPCRPCPDGTIPNADATKCEQRPCPDGEAIVKGGKCGKCPPGQRRIFYRPYCRKCRKNYFMPYASISEECFPCTANSFALKKGAKECVKCPLGQVMFKNGECGTCPPGTEYDKYNFRCEECAANRYRRQGMEFCEDCPFRTYALPGSSTCVTCPQGKALIAKTGKCETCSAGFFYEEYKARCQKCGGASIRSTPNIEIRCKLCPNGSIANEERTACLSFPL